MAYDAIIIGAGHNGLVAACELGAQGWNVLVLEAADHPGGAVQSAEITAPGFVSDLYSTNQNGFLGGPAWASLQEELRRHGVEYAHCDKPYANAFPDGTSLRIYQDAEQTRACLAAHDPRDAEGWEELRALFGRYAPVLFGVYGATVPSVDALRAVETGVRDLGVQGVGEIAQLLLASTRELGDAYLATREAKALMASWGMHVDYGPDVSGGSMFPFVECFADMQAGMSIVQGGASRLISGLVAILRDRGGELRVDAPVASINVRNDRASGVTLESGETIEARRAVIASVTPDALYTKLLAPGDAPAAVKRAASRYTYGPGTLMIHLALDERVPWRDSELAGFAYVHVAPYVEELAEAYTDAVNGILPASPLLVVGQSSVVDPTRAPEGRHVLWIQVRAVPSQIAGDRLAAITARAWRDAAEPYADRMLDKLEAYAPGLSKRILARAVLTPDDLQAHDRNLVGGDNGAGSHHLRQNFLFRPLAGQSRYRTPVDALWMTGAATWPGAGVTGIPGYLTAQELLADGRRGPAQRLRGALTTSRLVASTAWRARRGG
jgi:phytoene dehydrogenase-like protein